MNNLSFVETADGSNTIFNASVGENYHSHHGAFQESQHVFLRSGLEYFLSQHNTTAVKILEVGFGTGLNFLLTADFCTLNNIQLHYTGIEAFPLTQDIIFNTGYNKYVSSELWQSYQEHYFNAFDKSVSLTSWVNLSIAPRKLLEFTTSDTFDILYFDAFAVRYQPEMWNDESLEYICRFLKTGGVFVTYAITGNLKRSLKKLGFAIQKIPGAPGKREMLRAIKEC
jgi:tRNA U34 5-methylaminomethyl-2-thiouridine-forming methyltransferase MnmC